MLNDIRIMLEQVNKLTNQDLHLFRYMRSNRPYGLMDDRSQEIMRGTQREVYKYLDGMLKGIELYRSYLQDDQGLDISMLLEQLNQE